MNIGLYQQPCVFPIELCEGDNGPLRNLNITTMGCTVNFSKIIMILFQLHYKKVQNKFKLLLKKGNAEGDHSSSALYGNQSHCFYLQSMNFTLNKSIECR